MRLILDLSPMLVNRTAVFQIGRAVLDALGDLAPELQYFGERRTSPPSDLDALALRKELTRLLDGSRRPDATQDATPDETARRVFLDPLYVLFSPLSAWDVVLMHDLSPVTTPVWHDPSVSSLYAAAFRKIAKAAPQLIAVSHNSARTYHANYGYPARAIKVVHLFVPPHVLAPSAAMPASSRYFLFVGSLEARKNVGGAIEAFRLSRLAAHGYDLLVVGGRGHGADLALQAGATAPGVRFTGSVDDADLAGLYAGATGFVYPSYLEGFGVPLLEALSHGLPSVASVTGACPEVGGELIAYCDPDDHAAIAAELHAMARMSVAERTDFGRRARARVDAHFSPERFKTAFRDAVLA